MQASHAQNPGRQLCSWAIELPDQRGLVRESFGAATFLPPLLLAPLLLFRALWACITCRSQVLFVQGGASTQFAALPLNFAPEGATVDYVVTGAWGAKCVRKAAAAPPPCGV